MYDQLIPDVSMTGIEISRVAVQGDRAVIVTSVEQAGPFTDEKGNQLGAIGIAQLVREEDGWKFFSQVWHVNPTSDPVSPAMTWLETQ